MERAEAASLSYGGQRLLDMGLALADRAAHPPARRKPLARPRGGPSAPRRRAGEDDLAAIPCCWSSTTSDRVFQIADDGDGDERGAVLVHGRSMDARNNAKCARSTSAPAPRMSRPSRHRPRGCR